MAAVIPFAGGVELVEVLAHPLPEGQHRLRCRAAGFGQRVFELRQAGRENLAADGCRRARGRAACGSASAASRPRRCARCRGSGVAPARRTITTSMRHFSAMRARMRLTPCDGRGWLSLYFVETRRQRQVPFIRVRRSEARSPKETLVAVSIEPPDGYWFGVAFHCHLAQRSCRSGGGAQRCHH